MMRMGITYRSERWICCPPAIRSLSTSIFSINISYILHFIALSGYHRSFSLISSLIHCHKFCSPVHSSLELVWLSMFNPGTDSVSRLQCVTCNSKNLYSSPTEICPLAPFTVHFTRRCMCMVRLASHGAVKSSGHLTHCHDLLRMNTYQEYSFILIYQIMLAAKKFKSSNKIAHPKLSPHSFDFLGKFGNGRRNLLQRRM